MDDSIIHGSPLGPRVSFVTPMNDYMLHLTFDNGEQRIFDAKPLLVIKAFKQLLDVTFFNSVIVAYGSIVWPNDIDYCPDTLYAESILIK